MATPKQTAANRMNAQKSSGPRTTAGKAVSRFNALKHGIYAVHQVMFDEKPEDLAELAAEYHELYSPADSKERFLVDTLVHNEWRLRRTRRVEAELWQTAYNAFVVKNIEVTRTCTSGDAFATDSSTFERLQRVVNSLERAWRRALKAPEAKVGQALPPANVPANPAAPSQKPSQPQQSTPGPANLASLRQKPKTSGPTATQPAPAPPSAGTDASTTPAEARPPASDRDPKPPQTA
jgi:hypothetical protein